MAASSRFMSASVQSFVYIPLLRSRRMAATSSTEEAYWIAFRMRLLCGVPSGSNGV